MIRSTVLALALFATAAASAKYPERNIRLVVPFEPGGAGDTTSRIIVETANTLLDGARISVVNRSGGGGIVGQTFVARAPADGYTILAMTNSVVTNPKLKGASYSVDDFRPVAVYNLDPDVIAVSANSSYQDAAAMVAAAASGKPNMVIAGIATAHHMVGLAVEEATDLSFNYLPIRGFGGQLQAVLGRHADGGFWPLGEAASHARGGTVRILAIASQTRDERFPEVPTFVESGLGVPRWATFRGWAVPRGTPDEAVEFLSSLLKQVSASPEFRQKMQSAGYDTSYHDAAEFEAMIADYARLTDRVIDAHDLGN